MTKAIVEIKDENGLILYKRQLNLEIDFYDGFLIIRQINNLKLRTDGIPKSITILDRYCEKPVMFFTIDSKQFIKHNENLNIYEMKCEIDPF
jgi:hypothetical protein